VGSDGLLEALPEERADRVAEARRKLLIDLLPQRQQVPWSRQVSIRKMLHWLPPGWCQTCQHGSCADPSRLAGSQHPHLNHSGTNLDRLPRYPDAKPSPAVLSATSGHRSSRQGALPNQSSRLCLPVAPGRMAGALDRL
jgi:hypothetical protein